MQVCGIYQYDTMYLAYGEPDGHSRAARRQQASAELALTTSPQVVLPGSTETLPQQKHHWYVKWASAMLIMVMPTVPSTAWPISDIAESSPSSCTLAHGSQDEPATAQVIMH